MRKKREIWTNNYFLMKTQFHLDVQFFVFFLQFSMNSFWQNVKTVRLHFENCERKTKHSAQQSCVSMMMHRPTMIWQKRKLQFSTLYWIYEISEKIPATSKWKRKINICIIEIKTQNFTETFCPSFFQATTDECMCVFVDYAARTTSNWGILC